MELHAEMETVVSEDLPSHAWKPFAVLVIGVEGKERLAILREAVLSLQVFRRQEDHPVALPPHAEEIQWPSAFEHHIICDKATVATQKGFQSGWKINDGG